MNLSILTDAELIAATAPMEGEGDTKIIPCSVCGADVEVPRRIRHIKCPDCKDAPRDQSKRIYEYRGPHGRRVQ
jgi:DNA-directed RNA polymerase subunit RPC12/RpoP